MVQLNAGAGAAMLAVGAHAATDVTGFGLAGHGLEMALGSGVTLRFELGKMPLLPGVEAIARPPFLTRASKTNREYVQDELRVEGQPDSSRLECFFDAQTSGGLLVSVPPDRAEELVRMAREAGAAAACVVGEVMPRGEKALIVRG
jgi:selenide,water dikinase